MDWFEGKIFLINEERDHSSEPKLRGKALLQRKRESVNSCDLWWINRNSKKRTSLFSRWTQNGIKSCFQNLRWSREENRIQPASHQYNYIYTGGIDGPLQESRHLPHALFNSNTAIFLGYHSVSFFSNSN